jgi:hypothetical protein
MEYPEKLTIHGTQDEEKLIKNTTQYALDYRTKQLPVVDRDKHGLCHISQINVVIPN